MKNKLFIGILISMICLFNVSALDTYSGYSSYNFKIGNTFSEVHTFWVHKSDLGLDIISLRENAYDLLKKPVEDWFYIDYNIRDLNVWNQNNPTHLMGNVTINFVKSKYGAILSNETEVYYPNNTPFSQNKLKFFKLDENEIYQIRIDSNYNNYNNRLAQDQAYFKSHVSTNNDFVACREIDYNTSQVTTGYNNYLQNQTSTIYTKTNTIVTQAFEILQMIFWIICIMILLLIIWLIIYAIIWVIKLVRGR